MPVKLYVIPASHPSLAAELMLRHKGVAYDRRDLIGALHKPVLRALGFPGTTVPAMRLDGRRVQGSRRIARALDALAPEPALFPSDPQQRTRVEKAERWGDETLQPVPRRLAWWAIDRDRSSVREFLEGYRLGVPKSLAAATAGPVIAVAVRYNRATDENVRADLAALPELIDHVDSLIGEGVIGAEQPNAADFQIATSVRLLLLFDDLQPLLEGRPAAEHALRIAPHARGRFPGVFPPNWLPDGVSRARARPS